MIFFFSPQLLGLFKRFVKTQGRGQDFFLFFFIIIFCEQRIGIDHFLAIVLSAVIALWDVFNVCLFRGFPATAFLILKEN